MHLISKKDKTIFYHIPKNGGHTICPMFQELKWGEIKRYPPVIPTPTLKEYHLITIVRDPYERFFSGWKSIMMSRRESHLITPEYFQMNFDKIHDKTHIDMTQTQHLGGAYPYLNKVYRFENFKLAYDEINKKYNCGFCSYEEHPVKNKSVSVNLEDFLTNKVIDYINTKFDKDFKNFNYDKRRC